jgi:hypothetical protein
MSNDEEWDEFVNNLLSNAMQEYRKTKEYEYLQKQNDEIELLFRDNLTANQREMVEECLLDIYIAAENETEIFYKQGIKDCVWLLKNLGVLA